MIISQYYLRITIRANKYSPRQLQLSPLLHHTWHGGDTHNHRFSHQWKLSLFEQIIMSNFWKLKTNPIPPFSWGASWTSASPQQLGLWQFSQERTIQLHNSTLLDCLKLPQMNRTHWQQGNKWHSVTGSKSLAVLHSYHQSSLMPAISNELFTLSEKELARFNIWQKPETETSQMFKHLPSSGRSLN